ncbi:uncharacterized protein LOC133848318 [Drosophila sulfurigaster albostrigata]|uniref:uncharacterized protein LOC133848318 n=1 Tax=Drosophila sulfurigaster albostrigata TaxID=89887 RepID=UPI002D2194ED|nr:uncharacterized protein LOC133848318 [Drosophila sulfurigaster albostrigata]
MPKSETFSNGFDDDEDDDAEDPTPIGQFESVFLGKTELRHSHLNDSCESITYQDSHAEENPLIITNLMQHSFETPANTCSSSNARALPMPNPNSSVSSTATSTAIATTTVPNCGSIAASCSNPDDAFFLQYLGNKFGKYSKNTRNTVQFYISRILYKADMGYYENGDASNLFDADI